jgi:dTDP-4-dehydrorhamnose reductase
LYHLCADDYTNWYEFTKEILTLASTKEKVRFKLKYVEKVSADQYETIARRPLSARLCTTLIQEKFNSVLPHWKEGLQLCIEEIEDRTRYFGAIYE